MNRHGTAWRRVLALAGMASAPPLAAFAALAGLGMLRWDAAVIAGIACAAALAVCARHLLRDIARIAGRAREPGSGTQDPHGRPTLLPELAAAIDAASSSWERECRRLAAQAASAETILEGLPYPLILIDDGRHIVRATVGVTELLGAAGRGADLSSVVRDPGVLAAADRILAGGDRELVEFENLFPVRSTFSVQMRRLAPSTESEAAVVLAIHDTTEIRKIHEARTDFVANASHELKTPLAVLAGCVKTLQGAARDDPEAQRKFVGMMDAHIARMTRLIEDLLSLSRIEMNEMTPPDGVVDLSKLLADVARALQVPASERGIDIRVESALAAPAIRGDAEEITQLLQNLVDNAVKYSGDNSTVRIVARGSGEPLPEAANGIGTEISVIDNGPGIAEEHKLRLTERFYRVDAARSRELGGTGLGLAIVKHIVNRHRGRLEIESEVGRGSTFTVRLPAAGTRGPAGNPAPP